MNDLNSAMIVGRLTRDAELKHTNSGTAVTKFSIASSEYQGQGKAEHTNFIDCTLWAKRAEALTPYLIKGTQVVVNGTIHQSRWDSENGKRSKIEITVSGIQLVGGKKDNKSKPAEQEVFEDSIPF